jgi:hypothetical protein
MGRGTIEKKFMDVPTAAHFLGLIFQGTQPSTDIFHEKTPD